MFLVIRSFARPTIEVSFYNADSSYNTYWREKYSTLISTAEKFSQNRLVRIYAAIYPDEETFNIISSDPRVISNGESRNNYNKNNKIIDSGKVTMQVSYKNAYTFLDKFTI